MKIVAKIVAQNCRQARLMSWCSQQTRCLWLISQSSEGVPPSCRLTPSLLACQARHMHKIRTNGDAPWSSKRQRTPSWAKEQVKLKEAPRRQPQLVIVTQYPKKMLLVLRRQLLLTINTHHQHTSSTHTVSTYHQHAHAHTRPSPIHHQHCEWYTYHQTHTHH